MLLPLILQISLEQRSEVMSVVWVLDNRVNVSDLLRRLGFCNDFMVCVDFYSFFLKKKDIRRNMSFLHFLYILIYFNVCNSL